SPPSQSLTPWDREGEGVEEFSPAKLRVLQSSPDEQCNSNSNHSSIPTQSAIPDFYHRGPRRLGVEWPICDHVIRSRANQRADHQKQKTGCPSGIRPFFRPGMIAQKVLDE